MDKTCAFKTWHDISHVVSKVYRGKCGSYIGKYAPREDLKKQQEDNIENPVVMVHARHIN